ncbi:MAG: AsmA family protein [Kiritimatiellae bacterium]|nr:AsmA family protein [Kiritimatiellia bacterium]
MKKLGKILMWLVIVVVVVLLVAVLTLPMTIGPIVKTAASVGGPKALGVPVSVGDVKLNALAGNLTVSQVKVGNPQGYSDRDAFAVDKVEVGLNMRSLLSDTIVVRKIQIDAPAISFESKDGKSNFDAMMANTKKASEEEKQKTEKEKKPGKKVVIEEFSLNNAKVSYASGITLGKSITVPLPSLVIRDIGKKSGGATAADALTEVINGILGGLSQAVTGISGAASDLLKGVSGAADGLLKGAGDATKGATDALKGVTDGASDAASGAAKALKDVAGGATDAASGAAKALKDVAGGATDAASGAAKGVTDALKSLTGGSAADGAKETAADATKSAEGTAKDATDAAKDAAKSLKKLFK